MRFNACLLVGTVATAAHAQDLSFAFHPCPFLGPSYPKPTNISNDQTIGHALQNLTETIHAALEAGQIDNETSAISLTAFSTSDQDSTPFFSFHHTPPSMAEVDGSAKNVTGDAVYRIGSVSKVVTVYTLLAANGFKHWQSPITEFIPELKDVAQSEVPWDEVTIEALAAHLSGIGTDCKFFQIHGCG